MRQFYDPRISNDYPAYFCRGVQQAANLLYRLSSKYDNGYSTNKYKLKTADYLIQGSPTKISQMLDIDYDFNTHTVNEMFEFLTVLCRLKVIQWFGQSEIQLYKSEIKRLEQIGNGGHSEAIHQIIQELGYTNHARTNGRRTWSLPKIPGVNE